MTSGRRNRPQTVLHSTLEAIVAGVLCGAAYAVLFLGTQLVLVGGPNQAFDWREIPGALAWLMLPALIGGVFGAVAGLICGVSAGLALAFTSPHASRASLRVIAAVGAALPLWLVAGWIYLDDPSTWSLISASTLALIPSVIAATVAAVRAPALVGSRPGWATAEQRAASVERLDQ
jgi:hypothetical protein